MNSEIYILQASNACEGWHGQKIGLRQSVSVRQHLSAEQVQGLPHSQRITPEKGHWIQQMHGCTPNGYIIQVLCMRSSFFDLLVFARRLGHPLLQASGPRRCARMGTHIVRNGQTKYIWTDYTVLRNLLRELLPGRSVAEESFWDTHR